MSKTILLTLLCLGHFCSSSLVLAEDEFRCQSKISNTKKKTLISSVENQYKDFVQLTAQFTQHSFFIGLGKKIKSKGIVSFKKPGMMNWEYLEPDAQSFVADGSTLWFYQPDLKQVTLGDFTNSFESDLPVSFLLGVGRLSKNFKLKSACTTASATMLELAAKKPDPNLQEFYLLVDKVKHNPVGARIVDVGGNETSITFQEVDLKEELKDEKFTFDIPRGTDVIDQRANSRASRRR